MNASLLQREKIEQIPGILRQTGIDCWLIWVRETSQMLDPTLPLVLGCDLVWISALLFTRSGERIAIVGNFDAGGLPAELFDRIVPYTKGIGEPLRQELFRIAPQAIAINESVNDVSADGLTAGMKRVLTGILAETPFADRLQSAEPIVGRLRGRKTKTEVSLIRRAVEITETIYHELADYLRVGLTEREIHAHVHQRMEAYGVGSAWQASSNPAVDAGPNKEFGHVGPTDGRTQAGQLLHFDFGVRYNDYCSDLQRMYFFGRPHEIPSEIARAFVTVREAIRIAAEALRPGAVGKDIDAIARRFVIDRGYPEYGHALGHQLGRQAHDGGTLLAPAWKRYGDSPYGTVEEGNIFTLELNVPTQHFGRVSLEEDVLVTESGCEFLSTPQRELICLPQRS